MAQKNDKRERSEKAAEYVVVDNPFYDGVQLHPIGARILWSGPRACRSFRSTRRADGVRVRRRSSAIRWPVAETAPPSKRRGPATRSSSSNERFVVTIDP